MYEIKVMGGTNAILEIPPDYYWEEKGGTPSKAVMNLLFFLEKELNRLEGVDPEDLTPEAVKRMKVLKKFVWGIDE